MHSANVGQRLRRVEISGSAEEDEESRQETYSREGEESRAEESSEGDSSSGEAGSVRRQLVFPIVLPQTEMLPKNFACFCPKSEVDRDENLSIVRTFLQDTCPGW